MKILVACEESQTVCAAFRRAGHEAYSADILEPSGGHPEWHILGDVTPLLNGKCVFKTMDGTEHILLTKWDMIIAHPPCTYLSNVCNRAFSLRMSEPEKVVQRWEERSRAIIFFMQIAGADCEKIAIENPLGFMSNWRKPDQIVHPYYFADSPDDVENYHKKRTCFWLKGLPKLKRTKELPPPPPVYICEGKLSKGNEINWSEGMRGVPVSERAKARSKTFPGIAEAMVKAWG